MVVTCENTPQQPLGGKVLWYLGLAGLAVLLIVAGSNWYMGSMREQYDAKWTGVKLLPHHPDYKEDDAKEWPATGP